MTPFEYLLLWFGFMTMGFMIGIGSEISKDFYKTHLKHRLKKVHLIGKTTKQKVYNENKIN